MVVGATTGTRYSRSRPGRSCSADPALQRADAAARVRLVADAYDAGGFDRILALCRRWHELCLTDPVSAHPFEHPMHPRHDERLAAYLTEALGGPHLYTGGYGDESSMMRLHAGNGEHDELDEICLAFFDQALADVGITGATADGIAAYFRAATVAQHDYRESPEQVPDGLPLRYA